MIGPLLSDRRGEVMKQDKKDQKSGGLYDMGEKAKAQVGVDVKLNFGPCLVHKDIRSTTVVIVLVTVSCARRIVSCCVVYHSVSAGPTD